MQIERHALFWIVTAVVFLYLAQLLAPVLLPFVIGLVLAYFFNPVVDALRRLGIPRWPSSILLLALVLFLIVLAVHLPAVLNAPDDGARRFPLVNLIKDTGLAAAALLVAGRAPYRA